MKNASEIKIQGMKTIKLIFPHQLFRDNPLFSIDGEIYLVEEFLFFQQYNFHQQKIAFHRATMKYYEAYLIDRGDVVHYVESTEDQSDARQLIAHLQRLGVEKIALVDPVDDWLMKRIRSSCQRSNIALSILESPMFLNSNQELNSYFKSSKSRFFQTEFYKQQRQSRDILLDAAGSPVGGQWTFDVDNRKKYPKGKPIAKVEFPQPDKYLLEAHAYTQQYYPNNIGSLDGSIRYPIGFEASSGSSNSSNTAWRNLGIMRMPSCARKCCSTIACSRPCSMWACSPRRRFSMRHCNIPRHMAFPSIHWRDSSGKSWDGGSLSGVSMLQREVPSGPETIGDSP
ncbi:MAG TPA: cryptochrome/photolyase family protein, partial [Bacteroidia bacterium]|nr:cryptochrome/photolyase family protein [Bacteroidia bacterium]